MEALAVVIPAALAAGLVLDHLGSRSVWIDEGTTFTTASQHGTQLFHAALGDGGNMFLYYLGMHVWFDAFGTSEVSMRMPTALAAIATVPVCYFLLRRLFDVRAAVFGAFFVAVSAPFVYWAQTARAYVLALFLVCASTLVFVIAVQTGRKVAWFAYAVLAALAVYTILLSVLVVVAHGLSLAVRRGRARQRRGAVMSAGVIAVLIAPLAWVVAEHGGGAIQWLPATGPIYGATTRGVIGILASAHNDVPVINDVTLYLVSIAMALCWALGAVLFVQSLLRRGRGHQSWGYGLLLAWLVLPPAIEYAISVTLQPVFDARYVLASLPAASMLAAVALSRLRLLALAIVAAVPLLALRASATLITQGVSIENWRQLTTAVLSRTKPHDCIGFFVEDGYTAFDYYVLHPAGSHGPVPSSVLPNVSWKSRSRYSLDPQAVPPARMREVVASCPRLWLVTSHALGYPPGPGVLPYRVRVYQGEARLSAEVAASYRAATTWSVAGAQVSLFVRT